MLYVEIHKNTITILLCTWCTCFPGLEQSVCQFLAEKIISPGYS